MNLLPEDLLNKFRARAAGYDASNSFCIEDFEDLRNSGYLLAAVPKKFGGSGLKLIDLQKTQRTLAKYAPATALAVNMHLLWSAVASYLMDRGDDRLQIVFTEMQKGETFAFGISEAKNDLVLLDSFCNAEETPTGFEISGKKIFTTLSPVWTRLGVHARTTASDPIAADEAAESEIIVGFMRREETTGISYPDEWNTLGMRATQSWNTVFEKTPLAETDVVARFKPHDASDPLIMAVSLCFGILTSSVYAGIADRAIELAEASVDLEDPYSMNVMTQTVLEHRAAIESLERLAENVDALVLREDYSTAVAAVKNLITDDARKAVDTAMRFGGSRAFAADSELSRLYRDVVAGIFHPRSAKSLAAAIRKEIIQKRDAT